ncbi:MAG: hypothetical protein JXR49_21540 [Acidobacteria bacterium]|nr:hypothetical protein [Acidobacteriota bacterium]
MITLLLFLALQVTASEEMACIGSVVDFTMPADLYIAGVEQEGTAILASEGQIVYLNGPKTGILKAGEINSVIRPEGIVRDPSTGHDLGLYYKDLGTVRIESVQDGIAIARIVQSCCEMIKGDLVVPKKERPAIKAQGEFSDDRTPIPSGGITGSILLGKDNLQELSTGHICFINLGSRDGIKTGDRFTVFHAYPPFDKKEIGVADVLNTGTGYLNNRQANRKQVNSALSRRKLPGKILGDIVIVDAGNSISTGKIINSLSEIHPGDSVVKR